MSDYIPRLGHDGQLHFDPKHLSVGSNLTLARAIAPAGIQQSIEVTDHPNSESRTASLNMAIGHTNRARIQQKFDTTAQRAITDGVVNAAGEVQSGREREGQLLNLQLNSLRDALKFEEVNDARFAQQRYIGESMAQVENIESLNRNAAALTGKPIQARWIEQGDEYMQIAPGPENKLS